MVRGGHAGRVGGVMDAAVLEVLRFIASGAAQRHRNLLN